MKKFGLAAAFLLMIAVYLLPYRLTLVSGPSMTPTIADGTLLLVDRSYYSHRPIQRGDIVTFHYGREIYLKRVYGLPGDEIIQLHTPGAPDTIVLPDQVARVEHSVIRRQPGAALLRVKVPAGRLYLLGDGGMLSRDSRDFGTVAQAAVTGKVISWPGVESALSGRQVAALR